MNAKEMAKELIIGINYENQTSMKEVDNLDGWIELIAPKAEAFFNSNPTFLNDYDIMGICCPCDGCIEREDGSEVNLHELENYDQLNLVLNDFNDNYYDWNARELIKEDEE